MGWPKMTTVSSPVTTTPPCDVLSPLRMTERWDMGGREIFVYRYVPSGASRAGPTTKVPSGAMRTGPPPPL
ncbi:hypothetical protein G6F23_015325 [Rhizopus arrhizus]|nr:hypothetical protein G6F23_015325 [Rhizopus arrhizus]